MSMLLIITGASRGLGRAIAVAFVEANNVDDYDSFGGKTTNTTTKTIRAVLIARSASGLEETEQIMKESLSTTTTTTQQAKQITLTVSCHEMNLSDLDSVEHQLDRMFDQLLAEEEEKEDMTSSSLFDHYILVNNAGSLGHLGSCGDLTSLKELRQSIDLNVTASLWLSARFLKFFHQTKQKEESSAATTSTSACTVVNISSLCAIEPFKTMGVYCAGKAARDMFHSVMAAEEGEGGTTTTTTNNNNNNNNNIKVLNYAPGACETDMTDTLRSSRYLNGDLQTFFQESHEKGTLIQPNDTARKLVKLVLEGSYESGKHIDYWDLETENKNDTT